MNKELTTSLMENFIRDCQKKTISKIERAEVIKKLLEYKNCSQRQLAKELGLNYSTLHDWVSLRQDDKERLPICFNSFYQKLLSIEAKDVTDWGRLEQIRKRIETLERCKK